MAQVKIYSRREHFEQQKQQISDVLHACICECLSLPQEKRFHRFIPLENDNFIHPKDRSSRYTIIEIDMFSGRTVETKK